MTVQTEEPVAGEIVQYAPPAGVMEEYRPRIVMAPDEAKALDDQLRASMRAVLRPEVDYGKIPGSNKDSLLKPGAEKLLQWFGFGHTLEQAEVERDSDGRWFGVTYRCIVSKGMPDGRSVVVATCDGYAGYDEDRFFTSAEQAEAKERANAARYNRAVNTSKFAEYRAPRNSVIKMSQKRAMVGAALQATSASSLFTQDMEDMVDATAVPAALSAAGRAAIAKLPKTVRAELDAWYSALNWPGPDKWDAEQWCTALVKAGKLSVETAPAKMPVPAEAHEALREEPPAEAQKARAQQQAPAAKQERPAEPPLPDGVDRIAQVFAERASKAATAEDLAAILNEAAEVNKMDARIREPGGAVTGTLRAYFTYCENTLQEPAGSPA